MNQIAITVIKHSESGKSAFCRVSVDTAFGLIEAGVGYLYPEDGKELPELGSTTKINGFKPEFKEMVNSETGEVRTTKQGVPLKKITLVPA